MTSGIYYKTLPARAEEIRTDLKLKYPRDACYIDRCCIKYLEMDVSELHNWLLGEMFRSQMTIQWHEKTFSQCSMVDLFYQYDEFSTLAVKIQKIGQEILCEANKRFKCDHL